jgi:uncharacterized protein YdcH (DUF465 family)
MYRKPNGSKGFSFGRLIANAVPNFASDGAGVWVEVTPERRDMLYMHQINTLKPEALDENAFFVVGVCDRERQSQRIHSALLKNGVLTTPEGLVDTYKIGPKFIHQLAFIAQASQRNLINVLFWWEEEMQRFRKLVEEEKELDTMISELEARPEETADRETLDKLKFARERVRMKKRQRPSQRNPAIEADTDATVAAAFSSRRKSDARPGEMPPAYVGPQ